MRGFDLFSKLGDSANIERARKIAASVCVYECCVWISGEHVIWSENQNDKIENRLVSGRERESKRAKEIIQITKNEAKQNKITANIHCKQQQN